MELVEFIILLVIAGICGAIGQLLAGYSPGGLLLTIGVGFVGALIGMAIARAAELPEILPINVNEHTFPVVWSILGGALFVAILGMVMRRTHHGRVTRHGHM